MKTRKIKLTAINLILTFSFFTSIFAQSGGAYQITQSVTATGGKSSGGNYSVEDTDGQTLAGGFLSNSSFSIYSGFWTPPHFTPTAATVSIGGRVTAGNGVGVRNAILSLTDASGTIRRTRTATFGYFSFDNVQIGENYILSVSSKRFIFINPTRVLYVQEELTDIDFTAEN